MEQSKNAAFGEFLLTFMVSKGLKQPQTVSIYIIYLFRPPPHSCSIYFVLDCLSLGVFQDLEA